MSYDLDSVEPWCPEPPDEQDKDSLERVMRDAAADQIWPSDPDAGAKFLERLERLRQLEAAK